MKPITTQLLSAGIALAFALVALPIAATQAEANEIRQIVNNTPITSYDIQRRAAFLRLQGRGGNESAALEELVEQTLRAHEISRLNIRITDQALDEAYARFGQSNNISVAQLDSILSESGVTRAHFREFMRVQMGWGQALQARAQAGGGNQGEALRIIQREGGQKPTATEYMLQQVIFVVPERDRGRILAQRRREAEALRGRFSGCDNTRQLARGIIDVTVRDLGRVLEPELPTDWERQVKAANVGGTTTIRDTAMGVEFLAICSARQVSDDHVAELLHQRQQLQGNNQSEDDLSRRYTAELRERARIVSR